MSNDRDDSRLNELIKQSIAAYNAMTPEQQREHGEAQRQSWARGNVELDRMEREERMTTWIQPRPLAEPMHDVEHKIEIVFSTREEAESFYGIIEDLLIDSDEIGTISLTSLPPADAAIIVARAQGYAEGERAGLEKARQIALADTGTTDCPYATDKLGDPTWGHKDEDICPLCGETADDGSKCRGLAKIRIANRIRALLPPSPEK